LFERGQTVYLKYALSEPRKGVVLSDTGGPEVVITRFSDPRETERILREALSPEPVFEVPPLQVVTTERGDCATQRQSRKLGRRDMAEGQFTICGLWVQTQTPPARAQPTCKVCVERLLRKKGS
jgi:hypothetical protein